MKQDLDSENFKIWPFREEGQRQDGEKNNGGIDLVVHPEQIDKIHEATPTNGLRQLLQYLNREAGGLQSLGCAAGLDGDRYFSYFEFTLRDRNLAQVESWPQQFERRWLDWTDYAEVQAPGLGSALRGSGTMEYREFAFRGSAPQLLVTLYSWTQSEADHAQYFSYLLRFFEDLENDLEWRRCHAP
jgi:hypothetical protein